MKKEISHILEQIDIRQEELLELTKRLIRYETPAPPARNTNEAQQFIADFLTKHRFAIDKWFSEFNIPAVIYGPGTIEEAHSVNEKVQVEQLVQYTKVITAFIYEWCHTKK